MGKAGQSKPYCQPMSTELTQGEQLAKVGAAGVVQVEAVCDLHAAAWQLQLVHIPQPCLHTQLGAQVERKVVTRTGSRRMQHGDNNG